MRHKPFGAPRMNNPHKNARMTPLGRAEMVRRILEEGRSITEVAAGFGISERTARKWLGRWRSQGPAGLENRSSRPHREYRLKAEEIAGKFGMASSSVAGWLTRKGLGAWPHSSRRRRCGAISVSGRANCSISTSRSWPASRASATASPATGASEGLGYDYLHVAIDDATRLVYVEILPDEKRWSTAGFLIRALRWFRDRGVRVERVMTYNGAGFVARLFAKVLRLLRICHIRTRPYTPKTNGKAERFIQTMLREWAYAIPLRSSRTRAADLPRWIAWYNQHHPMLALTGERQLRPSTEQPDQFPHLAAPLDSRLSIEMQAEVAIIVATMGFKITTRAATGSSSSNNTTVPCSKSCR